MKFFGTPYSSNVEKVHFFLNEIDIPFEYRLINLAKGENRSAEYAAQNPRMRVPSIDVDGFRLFESQAILRYLAGRYRRFDWYPSNLEERALIDAHMDFANIHVGMQLTTIAWEKVFAPKLGMPLNRHRLALAELKLPRELNTLEQDLIGRNFLCGPGPTLADACLLPIMSLAPLAGVCLANYPMVTKWLNLLSARPAWKEVLRAREKAGLI